MDINKRTENGALIYALKGKLDTTSAPALEKELETDLSDAKELVFDLEDLEYISSAGLRILLSAKKQMGADGRMVVRHVQELVMEVFEITGFADILTIE